MIFGRTLFTASVFCLALAGCQTAPVPPPAKTATTTYQVGAVTYTSHDKALAAYKDGVAREVAQVKPMPAKAGGRLLVALPLPADVEAAVFQATHRQDASSEWTGERSTLGVDASAEAIVRGGLFDAVQIVHVRDTKAEPQADADYKLWMSLEPNGRVHWFMTKSEASPAVELVFSQGHSGTERLDSFNISVQNAAQALGAPVEKLALPASKGPAAASSGTGFFIDTAGHLLTGAHVVNGCRTVKVVLPDGEMEAATIALDRANDLALLKVPTARAAHAWFRSTPAVRQGENVVVYGYPLVGALSSTGNLSTGIVSALAGAKDDTRLLQISAPVQPGNSGGPVLDNSGHVIGIILSKINALAVARVTGDVPQNINFAIKTEIAATFLAANGVKNAGAVSKGERPIADLGDEAKAYTFMIKCQK